MLPFLKKRQEGAVAQDEDEVIERKHDDDFDLLDAVAEDLLEALVRKDVTLIKEALSALCDHIKDMDAVQDEE